jgi:hypothetical protein
MLWAAREDWWLSFGISVAGLVHGVAGVVLWVRWPPKSS